MRTKRKIVNLYEDNHTFSIKHVFSISFILNIDKWLHTLFVTGGANIYFMDNSMKSDYNTISQIILPQGNTFEEFNLDDIFSF